MSVNSQITRISNAVSSQSSLISQIKSALEDKVGGIIPSGTLEITSSGVYNVAPYANANVAISSGPECSGTIDITSNGTKDVTKYAYANVNVPADAVCSGSISISTNGSHDVVGKVTANVNVPASAVCSGSINITSNGSHQVTGKATANVNVPASAVCSGSLSITQNGTFDVTGKASVSVNVPSSSAKAIQVGTISAERVNSTSYTKLLTLTVEKTGVYNIYWSHVASAASTSYYMTRYYKGTTATGSIKYAPALSSGVQEVSETNVSLNAGDVVNIYGRSRGSSYYTCASGLRIEEV